MFVSGVSELREQLLQLVATAVHVADDVERPVVGLPVVPQELTLDLDRFDVLGRLEDEDVPEPFLLKVSQRVLHLAGLLADHVRAEGSLRPIVIALLAESLG